MTDEEIVKALECCNTAKTEHHCDICPFYEYEKCTVSMLDSAVDLIKRQKEEINALNGNTEKYIAECEKRSREISEDYRKETKSEAIKEFAERLKATYPPREDKKCTLDDCYTLDVIDNLVKEITKSEE